LIDELRRQAAVGGPVGVGRFLQQEGLARGGVRPGVGGEGGAALVVDEGGEAALVVVGTIERAIGAPSPPAEVE